MLSRYFKIMAALAAAGAMMTLPACRSEADKMAEFCLDFDKTVQNAHGDCRIMAESVSRLIETPKYRVREKDICEKSTACLPCRRAVRDMLKSCGYAEEMKPVYKKMRFSTTLRDSMIKPEDGVPIL